LITVIDQRDYGDAPLMIGNQATSYATTGPNAAAHVRLFYPIVLGSEIDIEGAGQLSSNAAGDDSMPSGGIDDEVGVTIGTSGMDGVLDCNVGTAAISGGVTSTNFNFPFPITMYLVGWLDWNADGD
jgi:hypothetical protein